jgi:hypothetical protein
VDQNRKSHLQIVRCPKELEFLRPVVIKDLQRIGNLTDGGYVMSLSAIMKVNYLLSLGLGENWSFERTFSEINERAKIDIYDDTVSLYFFLRKAFNGLVKLVLFKESLAGVKARINRLSDYFSFWYRNPRNTHHEIRINMNSFERALSIYPIEAEIGLKVDIEGSEWELLDQIIAHQSRFRFILMEVHDFDLHALQLKEFFDKLLGQWVLSHLHANNFEGLGMNGFPRVFEITLLKDQTILDPREYRNELPIEGLDVPNAKNRPDFVVSFS